MKKKKSKTLKEFSALIRTPEIMKKILDTYQANYSGQYTLGIGQDPDSKEFFVSLHVAGEPGITNRVISIGGCEIPLRITGGLGTIIPM